VRKLRLKIGVIGCGGWGKNLVRAFRELNVLHAVCDINKKALPTELQGVKLYTDYAELLKNTAVDAVVIASPATTHYQIARDSLLSDKNVFVEKPLAMSYERGKEIVKLAEERNKILMVGHIMIYHPAIVKLKSMISEGKLGRINYVYSNRLNLGKIRTEENILWSFAPHDISTILFLLEEMPNKVAAYGGAYLKQELVDITITNLSFPSGVKAHIFVSWLHPYKEQKLIVVGSEAMAVFDDLTVEKLFIYPHKVKYEEGKAPIVQKELYELVPELIKHEEPLKLECEHFVECLEKRSRPKTDGSEALAVLKVLSECQKSLDSHRGKYFIHESSYIDANVKIGVETKIWHFCHILENTVIGSNCNIGQNVMIGSNVKIGNNVKIQNNVSVYEGVTLEDDVFCGPSCVFTNVVNPRSHVSRKSEFQKTLIKRGATIGANATILCGITVGKYAFIGAGAIVTKDVPSNTLVYGTAARERRKIDDNG